MGFDAKKWLPIGFKIAGAIPGIINVVEKTIGAFKPGGQHKEDAAVDLMKLIIEQTELVSDKDLVHDEEVVAATRSAMKAIVDLQNVIAKVKAAKVQG